ncbi:hypothetical protein PG994_006833 [Apiospora phragmitis]|uniref:Uncharacterized protein n=1 Tax=Apiospora phragmitis TaxID=2905665 RepID=A0ABR1VG90_9PEZI
MMAATRERGVSATTVFLFFTRNIGRISSSRSTSSSVDLVEALELHDEPVAVAPPRHQLELLLHRLDVRHLEQVGADLEAVVAAARLAGPVDVDAADARLGDLYHHVVDALHGVAGGRAGPTTVVDELDEEQIGHVGGVVHVLA